MLGHKIAPLWQGNFLVKFSGGWKLGICKNLGNFVFFEGFFLE